MTDLTASPLALAVAEARRHNDAKAVDAAIAGGRVIPADDGMMLEDGITDTCIIIDADYHGGIDFDDVTNSGGMIMAVCVAVVLTLAGIWAIVEAFA